MLTSIAGRSVIVTGASKGIGNGGQILPQSLDALAQA